MIASFNGSVNPNFLSRYETTGHQMFIYMTTDITVVDRGFMASFEESKTLLGIHIWEYLLLDTAPGNTHTHTHTHARACARARARARVCVCVCVYSQACRSTYVQLKKLQLQSWAFMPLAPLTCVGVTQIVKIPSTNETGHQSFFFNICKRIPDKQDHQRTLCFVDTDCQSK